MKINHDKTKNKILDIAEVLRNFAKSADTYKQSCQNVLNNEAYNQEYKNKECDKLRIAYLDMHLATREKIVTLLEEVGLLETENEEILELDVPEFANTINAINAAQGKLSDTVINSIKINFAGQHQALATIKSVFENFGIDLNPYGYSEYTEPASMALMPLISSARAIEQSEDAIAISLKSLFDKIIHFGEVRGIAFSDADKVFIEGIDENIDDLVTRKAMGL